MLKAQLHIHVLGDPIDCLTYTAKDVIDKAAKLNFEVLAFTLHDKLLYTKEIIDYAKSKNILLIPGIEKTIENKHVLILGLENVDKINCLKDLEKIKDEALIIAPHPFYPQKYALKNKLLEHLNSFHAIEHAFLHTKYFDLNKKAIKIANENNKTILGMGDIHHLSWFNETYSMIDSKKEIKEVINAIKNNKIKSISNSLSKFKFLKYSFLLAKAGKPVNKFLSIFTFQKF